MRGVQPSPAAVKLGVAWPTIEVRWRQGRLPSKLRSRRRWTPRRAPSTSRSLKRGATPSASRKGQPAHPRQAHRRPARPPRPPWRLSCASQGREVHKVKERAPGPSEAAKAPRPRPSPPLSEVIEGEFRFVGYDVSTPEQAAIGLPGDLPFARPDLYGQPLRRRRLFQMAVA